jgi:hypothetical protein
MPRPTATLALLALLFPLSCRSTPPVSAPPPESAAACADRLKAFTEAVARLPDRTVASAANVALPTSTLGALPGPGPVLEVLERQATIDGAPLAGATAAERAQRLKQWAADPSRQSPTTKAGRTAFYIATTSDTDVQTLREYIGALGEAFEVRLLVRTPTPSGSPKGAAAPDDAATRLLLEQSPEARRSIAEKAYAELAECPALETAVASVRGLGMQERWPALKAALASALPQCDCSKVDTVRLQGVVGAEQQAGAGAVGFVPLSFLRDDRCGASMPLRSMQKLMQQIEQFDAEFAGKWQSDALSFDDVVVDDRLKVYFCNALPGETLAAKERARATLYLRQTASECDAWRFEPLAPGSPMGTWRRAAVASRPALAFHYWQAAEEIRVFGPVDAEAPSKPTDHREWACEQNHRLIGVDDDSLELESGRWFFSDAACRKAPDEPSRAFPCSPAKKAASEPERAPPAGNSPGNR